MTEQEMEHLISNTENAATMIEIDKKDANDKEEVDKSKSKLGVTSTYGLIMIGIGTMMYGITGILGRLSMMGNNYVSYNLNAALLMAEFGKFIVTWILLIYFQGISAAIMSIKAVPFNQWFLFCVPAIIYSITNAMDFHILSYMDPGSLSVLQQTKIITTALLWWYWFKSRIDKQQWISLILLCAGSMLVAWPDIDKNDEDGLQEKENKIKMYVEWPMGPFLVGIQVSLSAIAGIYTEFVYKKYGKGRSMHIDNLSMYFWGSLSNLIQFWYFSDGDVSIMNLTDGFNKYVYISMMVYVAMGLSVAYVMKYFSNIVKLFMSGLAIIVSGILTWSMFGLHWTSTYCLGLLVVVSSVILYKSPKKCVN